MDVAALGADFYATSAYKWSGPHIGTVVADPALLDSLHPDKLAPAPAEVPGRFERGTAAFADLAGVVAAVEHLASLGHGPDLVAATRRQRVLASMATVEDYETQLFAGLLGGLDAMEHVTLYGRAARRAPTAFFTVAGRTPRQVAEHLAARAGQRLERRQLRLGAGGRARAAGLGRRRPGRPGALQRPGRRRPAAGRGRGACLTAYAESRFGSPEPSGREGDDGARRRAGSAAMLAGLLRDLTQLAASPSGLTALALGGAAVLAGAMLAAAVLALLTSVASLSRTTAALPMIRRASALREKSWRAAFLRQRDPDAAGRSRPRAPSAALAAARSR